MKTRPIPVLCLLFSVLCLSSGCAVTYYHEPQGPLFFRITFGTDQQIGPVDLKSTKSRVTVGGVKSDQSAAAGTVTQAAIEALKPSLLP